MPGRSGDRGRCRRRSRRCISTARPWAVGSEAAARSTAPDNLRYSPALELRRSVRRQPGAQVRLPDPGSGPAQLELEAAEGAEESWILPLDTGRLLPFRGTWLAPEWAGGIDQMADKRNDLDDKVTSGILGLGGSEVPKSPTDPTTEYDDESIARRRNR